MVRLRLKIGCPDSGINQGYDRDPFKGIGKPEPLKGNWAGYWSRRIDLEHRLVYKVSEIQILIVKCNGHY
jgi:toxin YoeB